MIQALFAFVVMLGYFVGAGFLVVFLAAVYDWLTRMAMGDVDGESFEPRCERVGIRRVRR